MPLPSLAVLLAVSAAGAAAQGTAAQRPAAGLDPARLAGLPLRPLGPAVTSGRINAIAVDSRDASTWYLGAASGGLWKTTNAGTTWTPQFDQQGSYSIGAVAIDPRRPNVVWVGTGEHNAQRSVGYGDGVYRSEDGGRTWRNVGLRASEHIGRIAIHPYNTDTVYVAAQGPLWGPGGDRGLYKTEDAGRTWKQVLAISRDTGVTDVVLDPRRPEVVYAASWQRRRHVHTYLGGGPESGIHRSEDGGATWTRLRSGLPGGDLGRIGLAASPADPELLYATVEAQGGAGGGGGTYASRDGGATWERRGTFVAQGMYYGQIVADPHEAERIYLMSVQLMVSDDGGRTVRPLGERNKHVDNHALWIDPARPRHYLVGCDGGLYESWDRGETWRFHPNLPLAQFYRVTVDHRSPFYRVYGGTQDNNSLGGPSRTRSPGGIASSDWYVTLGGDGFHQQVDPTDPDVVYSVLQYGGLSRLNLRTGERASIQPQEGRGEPPLRWNWDSPLLISPHAPSSVYFAANRLFRSDDRGSSWRPVSGDLSRGLDRHRLPVMGRFWPADAVALNQSTSFYGNIVALAESPRREGLLYAGTDDGLLHVSEDGGGAWRKIEKLPGVPERAYISRVLASRHDADTVYLAAENHKEADFRPYLLRSRDRGRTWSSLAAGLPENGPVLALAEDPAAPGLLFAGTEFGLFFTLDGGKRWTRFRGLPTIPVRDLAIQERETDLVIATFGRGFYVLDDYTPLRETALRPPAGEAALFPVRETLAYVEYSALGGGRGSQGETYYLAPNPPYGAAITYYLRQGVRTRRQQRQEREAAAQRRGDPIPFPTPEELRAEADEDPPAVLLNVTDAEGRVVRRLTGPAAVGVHRVTWDLRGPALTSPPAGAPPGFAPRGYPVLPGEYRVSLSRRADGKESELGAAVPVKVVVEGERALSAADRQALAAFRQQAAALQRAFTAAAVESDALLARLAAIRGAVGEAPARTGRLREEVLALEQRAREVQRALRGDRFAAPREEPVPPSIGDRVQNIVSGLLGSPQPPTGTRVESYAIAAAELREALDRLRALLRTDMPRLERELDAAGVPYTPGRLPDF